MFTLCSWEDNGMSNFIDVLFVIVDKALRDDVLLPSKQM